MYQVSYDGITRSFNTMGDLLVFMNEKNALDGSHQFNPAGNVAVEKNGWPLKVVRNEYGRYGVQQEGSAFDLLMGMLDEVGHHYVIHDGNVLHPHEMTRSAWAAVTAVGRAAYNVYPCFTAEQLQERREVIDARGASSNATLSWFCEIQFAERFGYGHNGPYYGKDRQTNSRHEVHVAYALAAGKKVPEAVLDEYRGTAGVYGRFDIGKWFKVLIDLPQLRGRIPAEKLHVLCSVLGHEKLSITVENAPEYIRLMDELPDGGVHHVQMDDFLYSKGILTAKREERPPVIVDLSTAVSPLALRIRQLIGESRQKKETHGIEEQRARGNLSLREFERAKARIERFVDEEPMEWSNKMALAVANRDIDLLLHVLDTPDDRNSMSKKAIEEHCGLKLRGLKAKERRDAIFVFCGYDSEKQRQYEQEQVDKEKREARQRASKEAEERASQSKWRVDGGDIVSGKEYVDSAVAEGYTIIVATRKGRALQYWLKNAAKGAYRNILSKDGTLDYARLVLGLQEERLAA